MLNYLESIGFKLNKTFSFAEKDECIIYNINNIQTDKLSIVINKIRMVHNKFNNIEELKNCLIELKVL